MISFAKGRFDVSLTPTVTEPKAVLAHSQSVWPPLRCKQHPGPRASSKTVATPLGQSKDQVPQPNTHLCKGDPETQSKTGGCGVFQRPAHGSGVGSAPGTVRRHQPNQKRPTKERPYTVGGGGVPPPPGPPSPPPLPILEADSHNFASAPLAPRGFKHSPPTFGGDHRGTQGGGVSQPNPPPPRPPPPSNASLAGGGGGCLLSTPPNYPRPSSALKPLF